MQHDETMQLVTPDDAARLLTVTPATLATWRARHTGPAYVKLGHAVRYRTADLEAFIDSRRVGTRTQA
ncbi:helix-turn-helix domain-containing protein [Bifidobacterium boum]|uniref:helix-turn-helix domain-containing protein n=2 Tax=Bifidobacterium TaxID=1678 RepID=UPI0039955A24